MLDKDADGLLSLNELQQFFAKNYTSQHIERLFLKFDDNNSGLMNIEEFINMMIPEGYFVPQDVIMQQVAQYI